MLPPFAEDLDQKLGAALHDQAMITKIRRCVHHSEYFKELNFIKRSGNCPRRRQHVQAA